MKTELSQAQWDELDTGQLTAPDGSRYSRRGTKSKRRVGDQLVAAGCPLVLRSWAGGRLTWFDGADAQAAWAQVRPLLTGPRRGDRDVLMTDLAASRGGCNTLSPGGGCCGTTVEPGRA